METFLNWVFPDTCALLRPRSCPGHVSLVRLLVCSLWHCHHSQTSDSKWMLMGPLTQKMIHTICVRNCISNVRNPALSGSNTFIYWKYFLGIENVFKWYFLVFAGMSIIRVALRVWSKQSTQTVLAYLLVMTTDTLAQIVSPESHLRSNLAN